MDDLDLLCQLLELGIERWGQLRTLAERVGDGVVVDDPERIGQVKENGEALEEFIDCWQTGRGPPVTRDVLEASGAISSNFIDEVSELAEELNGDGTALVEALHDGEVKRFRRGKADELETYLEDEGYIQTVDPLEPEQIRTRVTAAYLKHDVEREQAIDRASKLLDRLATPLITRKHYER